MRDRLPNWGAEFVMFVLKQAWASVYGFALLFAIILSSMVWRDSWVVTRYDADVVTHVVLATTGGGADDGAGVGAGAQWDAPAYAPPPAGDFGGGWLAGLSTANGKAVAVSAAGMRRAKAQFGGGDMADAYPTDAAAMRPGMGAAGATDDEYECEAGGMLRPTSGTQT